LKNYLEILSRPVAAEKIGLFRIAFVFVLLMQAYHFYSIDFIQKDVLDPVMHFSYPGLGFIEVIDPIVMHGMLAMLFISSLAILIGFIPRLFSLIYLLFFSYLFLLDKGYYNNHYYLICLLLLLFCFINSNVSLSIGKNTKRVNYKWEEALLLFQFAIVFIYAGLNKINQYWLFSREPIHHILEAKAISTGNQWWMSELIELLMVWGGMLFDLFIIPLLLWKKTRMIGVILFVFFNGINSIVFYEIGEIGIFPLLMLSSLILFFPAKSINSFLHRFTSYRSATKYIEADSFHFSILGKSVLILYLILQLTIPLRHHLFTGNVDYTGEGQRFAWRMKSVYKDFKIEYILKDDNTGIEARLDPRTVLTVKQYTNLGYYPELIIPVANNLRMAAIVKGIKAPKIFVDYQVAFMNLPMQYCIDPKVELSTLKYSPTRHSDWILPLKHD
jgi:hypothetical protein